MIGVIARADEHAWVREFFELFKTPWEFHRAARSYDVVLCADGAAREPGAKLVLIAYPKKRMVEAQYPDGEFDIFREDETITFGDLVPGFTMSVKDVFDET